MFPFSFARMWNRFLEWNNHGGIWDQCIYYNFVKTYKYEIFPGVIKNLTELIFNQNILLYDFCAICYVINDDNARINISIWHKICLENRLNLGIR